MIMKPRISCVLLSIIVGLSSANTADAADIRIGVPNWTSVEMTAHVIKIIAEQHLGLSVDLVEADNDTIYAAMGETGEIDLHPEAWLPNHQSYISRYGGDDGTVTLRELHYNAIQGVCVTRDAAEVHDVRTIHDLSDPSKASIFDHDGDGKGEMWIGADGWLSTPIEQVRARTYGYAETLDLEMMDESSGIEALDASINSGQPFVFFCYGPHHIFQLYDLVVLEEPAHDPKRWVIVTPNEADDWLEQSNIDVAWPPTQVHMAYARTLKERHPDLIAMLDAMSLNSRQVSEWTYARKVDGIDPAAFAQDWIVENNDLVQEWLDGDN